MAEALIDLEQVLRIRSKQEKLTSQEVDFLMTWKSNTLQQLTVSACAGGAIAWSVLKATGNLNQILRINLAGGAAALTAAWRFKRTCNSSIEQILSMDGSRMQRELANIILKRYQNHPMTTKLVSKRFYCENVFDDSTSDVPKSRWRFRNNFVESSPHPQMTASNESHDSHDSKMGPEINPVPMKSGFVAMENPFDCVFGLPPSVEEIQRPVTAKPPRKHINRKQKRAHRRHHAHHQDEYS